MTVYRQAIPKCKRFIAPFSIIGSLSYLVSYIIDSLVSFFFIVWLCKSARYLVQMILVVLTFILLFDLVSGDLVMVVLLVLYIQNIVSIVFFLRVGDTTANIHYFFCISFLSQSTRALMSNFRANFSHALDNLQLTELRCDIFRSLDASAIPQDN